MAGNLTPIVISVMIFLVFVGQMIILAVNPQLGRLMRWRKRGLSMRDQLIRRVRLIAAFLFALNVWIALASSSGKSSLLFYSLCAVLALLSPAVVLLLWAVFRRRLEENYKW